MSLRNSLHETRKGSFQRVFWTIMVLEIAALCAWLVLSQADILQSTFLGMRGSEPPENTKTIFETQPFPHSKLGLTLWMA